MCVQLAASDPHDTNVQFTKITVLGVVIQYFYKTVASTTMAGFSMSALL